MKVVPLSEAKGNLSRYCRLCHGEPVVVTIDGRPAFQTVPLEEGDDLIDRLIEQHPGFRKLLENRLRGRSISAAVAQRRLAGVAPARNRALAIVKAAPRLTCAVWPRPL
jgi:antitoxin (DNA-binding transcriptional repressor) of toxin-antitoxin stability system